MGLPRPMVGSLPEYDDMDIRLRRVLERIEDLLRIDLACRLDAVYDLTSRRAGTKGLRDGAPALRYGVELRLQPLGCSRASRRVKQWHGVIRQRAQPVLDLARALA